MLSIYTYPNNSGTGYIDPDYYGSTTPGSETGYYKRILDLKDGTYKAWDTGQTAPVDTVSDLITATGKFHKGVRTENGLENIMIYSYYNQPLITIDSVLINTNVSASDTDATPAARLTVGDTSDFVDGDSILLTGFDGTLAELNNDVKYIDVIDSTTADLYHDSGLTDPVVYYTLLTGQAVATIDYDNATPLNESVKVTLTGLAGTYDGSTADFANTSGSNIAQDRLHALEPLLLSHITGDVYEVRDLATNTPITITNYLNDNYTDFGLDGQTIEKSGTTPGKYYIGNNSNNKTLYRMQKAEYVGNPLTKQWVDGLNDIAYEDVEITDVSGNTTTNINHGYLYNKYVCAYDLTDRKQIGFGYYVEPVMNDAGTYPSAGFHINKQPKNTLSGQTQSNGYRPNIWANWDGLSDEDGGQYLTNSGTTDTGKWWLDGGTPPFTDTVSVGTSFLMTKDSKQWKASIYGPDFGIHTPAQAMSQYPGENSHWTGDTTYQSANMGSYLKTEIIWNPNNSSNMLPGYDNQNQINYSHSVEFTFDEVHNPGGASAAPAIWKKLLAMANGTSSQKALYADLVLSKTDTDTAHLALPCLLVPIGVGAADYWIFNNVQYVNYKIKCMMFDQRISDVHFGEALPSSALPYETYDSRWGGPISHVNLANTQWNALGSSWSGNFPTGNNDRVQSDYQTEAYVRPVSIAQQTPGPYSGGNISFFSAGENPYWDDTTHSGLYFDGRGSSPSGNLYYELTITSSDTTLWNSCRTGTIIRANGSTDWEETRYLKLKTATPTTKTFTLHWDNGGVGNTVDWQYAKPFTNTQMSYVFTTGDTWFNVGNNTGSGFTREGSKYFHEVTSITGLSELYETPEVRYLELDDPAGTTVDLGATITDSTTGNVALSGTHNHKADNPNVYFPGDQIYKQRTGASTYVNAAIVEDEFYNIDQSIASDFTTGSGTKPSLTVSQSTQGYISGVSLGSTGRITTGQKMLTIGTTPDSYTPPTPTPAEQEDIWDTDDEWASNGSSQLKVWPDHITPSSAVINYNSPTIVNNSQNGVKYTRSVGHTKWRLEVEYPPMSAEDFQEFHAIAQAAHGQSTPFYFRLRSKYGTNILWSDFYDLTNSTYTPRIKDAIVTGDTTMLVEGFNSNESNAFKRGEVFIDGDNENGFLHTSLSTTDSNVYGEAKIRTPWPFTENKPAGSPIYKDPFWTVVTLASDNFEYQVDTSNYYYVSVAFDLDGWKD
jgi:hypothetical protein